MTDKITEADLANLRNIDTRPGANAGGAIDKRLPPYDPTSSSADVIEGMREALIFVVVASTGEYSDRSEWPVFAFPTEDVARAYIAAQQPNIREAAQRFQRWASATEYDDGYDKRRKAKIKELTERFPFDIPGLNAEDYGTEDVKFHVYEIKYALALPDSKPDNQRD